MMVLCTGLLIGCDKEPIIPEIPVKPPVEEPEEPEEPEKPIEPGELPSTEKIINFNNEFMIVGADNNVWWSGIAYGNGKYVAVGNGTSDSGYITTSTDGENWLPVKTLGMKGWYNIAYGNGKFVVVGSAFDSCAASSIDGENWSELIHFDNEIGFRRIIFGNGKFVVVSRSGIDKGSPIISSTDGMNWTDPVYTGGTYATINDVAYGNGKFVAIGKVTNANFAITSTDGRSWSAPNVIAGSNTVNAIGFGNGKFVVGTMNGEITVSTDGINWSPIKVIQSGMQIMDITHGKGKFIMTGIVFNPVYGGYVSTSVDGENWSEPQQLSNKPLSDICAMP
ncbi:hypothetical protein EAJ06_02840 [Bacteroides intestinalis]|nr:hypothetical protein EAJ06_02840 [Bacteroides intestinalis]